MVLQKERCMMQRKTPNKLNLLALRRQYTNPHELYDTLRTRDSIYFDESSQSWMVDTAIAQQIRITQP